MARTFHIAAGLLVLLVATSEAWPGRDQEHATPERLDSAADSTGVFSKLEQGDTLLVDYESCGCNHWYHAEITILGSAPDTARVRLGQKGIRRSEPKVYMVTLSPADREGLDRLVAFYRSERPRGCTTWDKISIALLHHGRQRLTLSFSDGSCSADRVPGAVTLREIVRRR